MTRVLSHKYLRLAAVLCIFAAVGAALACQFHTEPLDHEHATSSQSHTTPSTHAMLDFSCLAAILPTIVFFAALLCFLLYAAPMLQKHTAPSSPLFKPPKKCLC